MSKAHYHDPIVPPVSTSGASKRLDALSFALGAADRIRAFSPARVRGNAFPPKPVDLTLVKSEKQAVPAPKPRLPLGKRPVMTLKRFTIILFDAVVTTLAMTLAIIFALPAQDALANVPAYAVAALPFSSVISTLPSFTSVPAWKTLQSSVPAGMPVMASPLRGASG